MAEKKMITYEQAQRALTHLQKRRNGQGQQRPPLVRLTGWERAKKVNGLKSDLRQSFKKELDRHRELLEEAGELQQTYNSEDYNQEKDPEGIEDRLEKINKELREMADQKREVKLSEGKLTKDEIEEVVTPDMMDDLGFAIDL